MRDQRTFAVLAWSQQGKVTRRERFLAEMDAVIPWPRLMELVEPYRPKKGRGRQPLGLEKMLRVYFLQQWFDLSDPQAEVQRYGSEWMRRFARIELSEDVIPRETTVLWFPHLLEKHHLTEGIFKEVRGLLKKRGLYLKSGTIVDGTIISEIGRLERAGPGRVHVSVSRVLGQPSSQAGKAPAGELEEDQPSPISGMVDRGASHPGGEEAVGLPKEPGTQGLEKNPARVLTMFALANLHRFRSELMPPGARCAL